MKALVLLLAACGGPPPVVDRVTPDLLWPGEAVVIEGAELGPDAVVTLVGAHANVPLPIAEASPEVLRTELPVDAPPGHYVVTAVRGRHSVQGPSLEVWTPESEPPCAKRYALEVDISRELRRIVVQRTFEGREPTRDAFVGDDLTALAWERRLREDGSRCEAIWLLDGVGRRWLIADDTERDLVAVAEHLGRVLDVPAVPLHGVTAEAAR